MKDPRTDRWRVRPSEPHDVGYPDGFLLVRGRRKHGDWFAERERAESAKARREREA